MCNKGFLFATSSQEIKSHIVESQIISLVWLCLSLTEKQRTITHMIIFNNSISKFYKCSVRNSPRHIYVFLVSVSAKKKKNFHTIFKLDFITQIIYCITHRCLYSSFIHFCSLTSVSKKWNIETMLTLPYSYNWQKFNNKINEKRSQDYQSMDPEYVTGQINSPILELLFKRFCYLIFLPSRKS